MSFIEVNDVSKSFRVSKRSAGIPGMLANLIVPKFETKQAGQNISFSSEEVEVGHVTFSPDFQEGFHLHTRGTFYLCC